MKNWKIENIDGLVNDLSKFAEKMQKKHAGAAVKRGANLIKEFAVENAKRIDIKDKAGQEESQIYKYIKARHAPKIGKAKKGIAYRVGVEGEAKTPVKSNGGQATPRNPPTYWRHVEFGTEDTAAQPFMRPALESHIPEIQNAVIDTLKNRLKTESDKI